MSLSVGIVGLPNVGKSTLFNALLKRQQALAANYPFATIEPNIGVVPVPDERLEKIRCALLKEEKRVSPESDDTLFAPIVPALVQFVDIAGLALGAHKGEGLGNKFLSHIREVNVILHVVRNFKDENIIRAGSVNPQNDIEIINTELILKDIETVQKMLDARRQRTESKTKDGELNEILKTLNSGKLPHSSNLSNLSKSSYELAQSVSLLTIKPQIIVLNCDEKEDPSGQKFPRPEGSLNISAKLESELSLLSSEDQKAYLKQIGISESGLDKVIKASYDLLGYKTFFTAGPKEVRAWQFKSGQTARGGSGIIHTDFTKTFIAADVVTWEDYVENGGWKNCKDKGFIRLEGRDYKMQDGDLVIFRVNTR